MLIRHEWRTRSQRECWQFDESHFETAMREDKAATGMDGEAIRMNVNNHDDASFWARYLRCTPEELWSALTAVGGDPSLVRDEIMLRRSRAQGIPRPQD
jgi:uncharacterized protein DUF3606